MQNVKGGSLKVLFRVVGGIFLGVQGGKLDALETRFGNDF
jgi:hypothetical protein